MLSSDERLLSQDESENHGATLPPLGEMFRLESDASVQVLESHSAPPPPPPTSFLCTRHLARGKVLPEEVGDIYIHLGRRKVRWAECGRQTGSGGLGARG